MKGEREERKEESGGGKPEASGVEYHQCHMFVFTFSFHLFQISFSKVALVFNLCII